MLFNTINLNGQSYLTLYYLIMNTSSVGYKGVLIVIKELFSVIRVYEWSRLV